MNEFETLVLRALRLNFTNCNDDEMAEEEKVLNEINKLLNPEQSQSLPEKTEDALGREK